MIRIRETFHNLGKGLTTDGEQDHIRPGPGRKKPVKFRQEGKLTEVVESFFRKALVKLHLNMKKVGLKFKLPF